jgi:hypothetical protein
VALVGNGTGTALGAGRHVNGGVVPTAFESGWNVPLFMFGIWGVLIYVWLYAAVLGLMWRGIRSRERDRRWLPTAVLVFCVLTMMVDGAVNYPPTNIYFWLFAGLVSGAGFAAAGERKEW